MHLRLDQADDEGQHRAPRTAADNAADQRCQVHSATGGRSRRLTGYRRDNLPEHDPADSPDDRVEPRPHALFAHADSIAAHYPGNDLNHQTDNIHDLYPLQR
ncbi:hypothetical protein D3C84_912740 [compost metagenome]